METKQFKKRNAILTCLMQTHTHPSAEMVHEMLRQQHPDISLATVYRNLTLFKNQGLIQSLGTVGGAERFDADTRPHVHFICLGCSQVTDLPEVELPEALMASAGRTGNQVSGCQVTFTGMCRNCQTYSPGEVSQKY